MPLPIDSITQIDGFRTYESLDLRHQQLAAQSDWIAPVKIGETIDGRDILAYTFGDEDDTVVRGGNGSNGID